MKFKDQLEMIATCMAKGKCQRDSLFTDALTDRRDNLDDLFRAKVHDDYVALALFKILLGDFE